MKVGEGRGLELLNQALSQSPSSPPPLPPPSCFLRFSSADAALGSREE